MDIDTHFFREFEELFREDLSIGDDDEIITLIACNLLKKFDILSDPPRGIDIYTILECE